MTDLLTPPDIDHGLSDGEVQGLDAYWRAANYLSVGQIYLLANDLDRFHLHPRHGRRPRRHPQL